MTQKYTLFSQEVEDFVLEIKIDADSRFIDLHNLILQACHYTEGNQHCFMICDEDWRVQERIMLHEDRSLRSDEDLNLMDSSVIGDFLEEEGQRLAYLFDPENKRYFLMELTENIFGQPQKEPTISRRHGQAPAQHLETPAEETKITTENTDMDENFYGNEDFAEEDIDLEGFEIGEE